jgi:GNAT superfamily N-acetyltransferase
LVEEEFFVLAIALTVEVKMEQVLHKPNFSSTPGFPAHPTAHPGQAYEAAHLRSAEFKDIPELLEVYKVALGKAESEETLTGWLEQGGALVLENAEGKMLCALRWREEANSDGQDGWRVDRVATIPEARGQGFGRWLMTKVEALAIRTNIPTLTLTLDEVRDDLLAYYQRMGYEVQEQKANEVTLSKRVGGTWQRKEGQGFSHQTGVGGKTGFGD